MRTAFADTSYWIALANPKDEWHEKAALISQALQPLRIVTTDEVLVEFLTFFSSQGRLRAQAAQLVRNIIANPNVEVLPQTRESFNSGVRLYEQRLDKEYSLTDCISMETMRARGLTEVLTTDDHFVQEGFTILLKE